MAVKSPSQVKLGWVPFTITLPLSQPESVGVSTSSLILETDQLVVQIAQAVGYLNTVCLFSQFCWLYGSSPKLGAVEAKKSLFFSKD